MMSSQSSMGVISGAALIMIPAALQRRQALTRQSIVADDRHDDLIKAKNHRIDNAAQDAASAQLQPTVEGTAAGLSTLARKVAGPSTGPTTGSGISVSGFGSANRLTARESAHAPQVEKP